MIVSGGPTCCRGCCPAVAVGGGGCPHFGAMRRRATPRLTAKRRRKALCLADDTATELFGKHPSEAFEQHLIRRKKKRGLLIRIGCSIDTSGAVAALGAFSDALNELSSAIKGKPIERKLKPMHHIFKMKQPVCPICGGQLYVQVSEWEQETEDPQSDWLASAIDVDCEHMPDLESDAFDEFMREHYRMPYVDWLPLEESIKRWMRLKYRFDMKEEKPVLTKVVPEAPEQEQGPDLFNQK